MKLSQILDNIDDRHLHVPAFQREYVWKRNDARQLVDSLIKEYPTGMILTWQTNSPPELKGDHVYDPLQGAISILLDGQQRITTLYMLIRGEIPHYYSAAEIQQDPRGLRINLETMELAYGSSVTTRDDPRWVDLTAVFKREIMAHEVIDRVEEAEGERLDKDRTWLFHDNVARVLKVLDRDFLEEVIPNSASVREAIDIFYKVNAGGVSLTDAELALAQISGYWPQARDTFKAKLNELEKAGFAFSLDFIVYALLGVLHTNGSDMRKLHGAENEKPMREAWDRLSRHTLDYVVNLMRTHAYVDHSGEVNSIYALIPVIVHCHRRETKLSELEIRKIVKWFYYAQIRRRYVSQLPQKLNYDLRIVVDSASPFDRLLDVIREDRGGQIAVLAEEFEGRDVRHALFGMMTWYLRSQGAICLTTGVSIQRPVGASYQLERDHIFPYSRLKQAGYGWDNRHRYQLAQELTNRSLLTQLANRTKSNQITANYLAGVKEAFPKALKLQCIPEDPELWQLENYELFLKKRRQMLADAFNAYLEGLADTEDTDVEMSLADMIAGDENAELEFKSSLRWDLREGRVNKVLEGVVVKTVTAFANAEGGTLLIGVDDERNILGLEADYQTLSNGDRDRFELHLRGLLSKHLGEAFVSLSINVTFPEVEEIEICRVDVDRTAKPIFVSLPDKGGAASQQFFVRNGNASQPLSGAEQHVYIQDRFD